MSASLQTNPLPIASNEASPSSMHREAARGSDAATLSNLARPTAMRFRLIRALMTLGSDGGLVSRERLVTVSRQGSRGTKVGPHGCSRSSAPPVIYLDDAMLSDVLPFPVDAAIEQRLRAGSPKSGARHVRINDDPMIGENMWASDEPRVHWTTYPLAIAGVCVALIFVLQLSRGFLASVFA